MLQPISRNLLRYFRHSQNAAAHTSRTARITARSNATLPLTQRNMANETMPITAPPANGQLVEHEGRTFTTIQEGKAYILVPPNARTSLDPQAKGKGKAGDDGSQVQNVFYNPIQQFNRDLSVLAIRAFAEDSCRRKSQMHEVQRGKKDRKKLKKRKREEMGEEGGDLDEGGGVKVAKPNKNSSVNGGGESGAVVEEPRDEGAGYNRTDHDREEDGSLVVQNGEGSSEGAVQVSNTGSTNETQSVETENNHSTAAHEWRPRFRILDALSATGLRALRYASEIPQATAVVANDRDLNAVKSINLNVQHNNLASKITTSVGDAQGHMYGVAFPPPHQHGPHHISGKYDVIDLDPYGTAAPFIDSALHALEDGGLLCVTCTDSGVFASCGYSEKTFALYGGMPVKGNHSHEGGLRLILHSIATSASRYGMSIEPLLSLSIDFYARLFIRVRRSPREVKFLAGKTMIAYNCDHGCGAWSTQFLGKHSRQPSNGKEINWKYSIAQAPGVDRQCEHCGSKTHVAGPMWGGPLHNPAFVEKILDDVRDVDGEVYQTKKRVEGMLTTALDELVVNSDTMDFRATTSESMSEKLAEFIPQTPPEAIDHHPFFFIPSALCKVIRATAPAEQLVKGALRHAGYQVTRSHCKAGSIKTNAPWTVIWEVMREWVRQKAPVKEGALKEGTPGWKILQAMRKEEPDVIGDATAENGNAEEGTNAVAAGHQVNGETKRLKVVFDEQLGKDKPGKRLVRYQMNPRENWGPMNRAKGHA